VFFLWVVFAGGAVSFETAVFSEGLVPFAGAYVPSETVNFRGASGERPEDLSTWLWEETGGR
jgi:hypothetical protein